MTGRMTRYFAGGNTAKGFYDLFESNIQGLEHVYLLKGGPGSGISSIIKKLAIEWNQQGYDTEWIHSHSDNEKLAGLIIPTLKFGVFDSTSPHAIEPKAPGAIEAYVNVGEAWDTLPLKDKREEIVELQDKIEGAYETAYDCFQEGLRIHDDLEEVYINEMDFVKANEVTEELISRIFVGKQSERASRETLHRFFGASTPQGVIDYIPNITEDLSKRYFIKGRAGTGKSTILKKVAAAAGDRGFGVEMYHCGFDPESIDMVVIRELGVCVFDSTDPHEYFPSRHGDEIVDVYEKAVTPGTDEKYESAIMDTTRGYKQKMKQGITYLQEAKSLYDQLEKIYIDATDFLVVDKIYEKLNKAIQELT
ncbi:PRK06851 family protein [Aquibacillus koreensis]|uniref:PRK06851 family protein n=1 Tax=Aquibacillus koreensis TaxID=279446 RepID=A0A9X3WP40_9BACI|nr:PRK06851 family protein [Aquibacillus koreensis]MCT2537677.1 PRK06851 family protein [Aquibacillus koreensis]MDC3420976.1 PRK06851 family protein [Aquibacillus koreensis]